MVYMTNLPNRAGNALDVLGEHHLLVEALGIMAVNIHQANREAGWWTDLRTGADLLKTRNRGEMLMLCVSELSEAEEADAAGTMDDKLPHLQGFHVELADTVIRLLDLLGAENRRHGHRPIQTEYGTLMSLTVRAEYDDLLRDRRGNNVAGDLMLVTNALSNALDQGYRKGNDFLARYWLTAALFRLIAVSVIYEVPLFDVVEEKLEFNRHRADHKPENRVVAGGKMF